MLFRAVLAALVLSNCSVAVEAADLPAQTRLGAVFADGPARHVKYRKFEYEIITLPWAAISPRIAGYYGTGGDFSYRSYYGTSFYAIWSRPPYSCAWYSGRCW